MRVIFVGIYSSISEAMNFIVWQSNLLVRATNYQKTTSSQVKLSFIVIPLHVGTYSGTKCRASQDHGAT